MTLKVIVQAGMLVTMERGVTNYDTGPSGYSGMVPSKLVPIVIILTMSIFVRIGHENDEGEDDLALC